MIHGYWLILNENFENELKIKVLSFERELGSFVRVGLLNVLSLFLKADSENDLKIKE